MAEAVTRSEPGCLRVVAIMRNALRQALHRLVRHAATLVLAGEALMLVLASSPPAAAQGECEWFGTAPFCNGECPSGYSDTGQRQACTTGHKVKCCRIQCAPKQGRNCRLTGPRGGQVCACDEFLKFHVKNDCKV